MTDLMVTLRGLGKECRIPAPWWVGLTNLAIAYGWEPSPESWSDPVEHCGEVVFDQLTTADARSLADALERALPDVPRHDALWTHPGRALRWDDRSIGGPYLSTPPTLHEW